MVDVEAQEWRFIIETLVKKQKKCSKEEVDSIAVVLRCQPLECWIRPCEKSSRLRIAILVKYLMPSRKV